MEEYLLEYSSFGLDLTRETIKLQKGAMNSFFDLFLIYVYLYLRSHFGFICSFNRQIIRVK